MKSPTTWLLSIPAAATLIAAVVEWYWAILFCIEATGRLDWSFETASGTETNSVNAWGFAFSAHIPVLLGLIFATVPIVLWSMVWLPVWMQARGAGRWRRVTMAATGLLANALVVISGTVVMNYNRQEQVRASLVTEQSADAGRAAIGARLQVAQAELARITDPIMTTNEARAARAGVAGWRTYIAESRADPDVPPADRQRIARAMGSAEAADALRTRIEALTVQQATAAPEAATAARVDDDVGVGLNTFASYAEVYRPPFVALLCTMVGIFGVWWWVALAERMRAEEARAGPFDPAVAIEDHSAEAPVAAQSMEPTRIVDAETGEELIAVAGSKPHLRRKKQRGPKVSADGIEPGAPYPVPMGAGEHGAEAGELEAPSPAADDIETDTEIEPIGAARVESAEEAQSILALFGESDPEPEPPAGVALPNGEGVMVDDDAEDHNAHVRARERAMEAA